MTLYPHQLEAKAFLLSKKRAILADEPRVGKTLPAAAAALENLPALVVCPAAVKSVWESAFNKLNPDVPVTIINGKKAAEKIGGDGVTIINYDLLGSIQSMGKFGSLILDEAHRIKGRQSIRSKCALKLMAKIPQVYALTGTPVVNRHEDLFNILKGLGVYRGTWSDFGIRYCGLWKAPWGWDSSRSTNAPELRDLVRPHLLRRTKEQVFTAYEKPAVSLITFDLPVDKREAAFDVNALVDHPNPILAFEGLQEIMIEGARRKVTQAAAFISGLLDQNEPVVCFTIHHEITDLLAEKLKAYSPLMVNGHTSSTKKTESIAAFQSGETNLIIGNEQSIGEGVDLSRANTIVFVQNSWSTAALTQSCSRIENINKNCALNSIYLLTTAGSLDHVILGKVLAKLKISNNII
jgi:SWI/SNF-related matrix-associated actin-dependent regulator 1 of chromatin subfamily A